MDSPESETLPIPSEGPTTEKIDRRKITRAPWGTTVLEDGIITYIMINLMTRIITGSTGAQKETTPCVVK